LVRAAVLAGAVARSSCTTSCCTCCLTACCCRPGGCCPTAGPEDAPGPAAGAASAALAATSAAPGLACDRALAAPPTCWAASAAEPLAATSLLRFRDLPAAALAGAVPAAPAPAPATPAACTQAPAICPSCCGPAVASWALQQARWDRSPASRGTDSTFQGPSAASCSSVMGTKGGGLTMATAGEPGLCCTAPPPASVAAPGVALAAATQLPAFAADPAAANEGRCLDCACFAAGSPDIPGLKPGAELGLSLLRAAGRALATAAAARSAAAPSSTGHLLTPAADLLLLAGSALGGCSGCTCSASAPSAGSAPLAVLLALLLASAIAASLATGAMRGAAPPAAGLPSPASWCCCAELLYVWAV
jgi:hypothetical protein